MILNVQIPQQFVIDVMGVCNSDLQLAAESLQMSSHNRRGHSAASSRLAQEAAAQLGWLLSEAFRKKACVRGCAVKFWHASFNFRLQNGDSCLASRNMFAAVIGTAVRLAAAPHAVKYTLH